MRNLQMRSFQIRSFQMRSFQMRSFQIRSFQMRSFQIRGLRGVEPLCGGEREAVKIGSQLSGARVPTHAEPLDDQTERRRRSRRGWPGGGRVGGRRRCAEESVGVLSEDRTQCAHERRSQLLRADRWQAQIL
jgi:hypothetical protein